MNRKKKDFLTYDEAKLALQEYCMSFNCILDYKHSYKDVNSRLPCSPEIIYKDWGGWKDFLGKS